MTVFIERPLARLWCGHSGTNASLCMLHVVCQLQLKHLRTQPTRCIRDSVDHFRGLNRTPLILFCGRGSIPLSFRQSASQLLDVTSLAIDTQAPRSHCKASDCDRYGRCLLRRFSFVVIVKRARCLRSEDANARLSPCRQHSEAPYSIISP